MNIKAIKTHKITEKDTDIFSVIDKYVLTLEENSVLVVTSKIISICEGRIQKINHETEREDKAQLVKEESERYLDASENKYGFYLTITHNLLIPTAGIDESNGNGYYILWPKDAQTTANRIREHLSQKFNLKNIGVLITDSKTTPLRWGTTGAAIAHSGFAALNNYMGVSDLFGREMRVTQSNVMDGLAAAAVSVMGEGQEQTPLALITDVDYVAFQDRNPTEEEIKQLHIDIEDDLYAPLIKNATWHKGDA